MSEDAVKYKLFYADGSVYTDEDGPPENAPARGVMVAVQADDTVGLELVKGSDYYVYRPDGGGWFGVDIFGLWDYLLDPGLKVVKFGRTINNKEYSDIIKQAMEDDYLPDKSGWLGRRERRPV